jgi:RNA polymerase sigma-70 factor (ECF subfamily)
MTDMDPSPPQASKQARESELALVARLRDGDPDAFDAVHDAFNARLFSFLARLSRRREVAEDLVEETWLRLVTKAPHLRPDTQLGPWLFTVARNLYVSYRRSRQLEDSHAGGLMGLWPSGSPLPSPFQVAATSEAERRIETAIGALPVIYREALLLVAVEGLKPAEAAAVCGISPEALRQRLSRARAALAEQLDADSPALGVLKEVRT